MKKIVLLAALLTSLTATAQWSANRYPSAEDQMRTLANILGLVSKATKGQSLAGVEVPEQYVLGALTEDRGGNYDFILTFKSEFQGKSPICVGVAHVQIEKRVQAEQVPCN